MSDTFRGHQMYFDSASQAWRYADDGALVCEHWRSRPCGKCGESFTPEGHDPCLGTLPGVMNACCGHGQDDDAYVQFDDGGSVHGSRAVRAIETLIKSRE